MEHINDIEFMDFIAGRLSTERSKEISRHMADCPECSERFDTSKELWNTLGQWDIKTSEKTSSKTIDFTEESRKRSKSTITRRGFWADILRVAALIICAVFIGQKLGRMSTQPKPVSQDRPFYVAALGLEWSTDFTWLMIDEDLPQEQQ